MVRCSSALKQDCNHQLVHQQLEHHQLEHHQLEHHQLEHHQLEQQQQCHQHQVQHQTDFLSDLAWPHTPYLSTSRILPSYKSYWQATLNGIWWINLSIVSRFCCNLGKLVALCAFWDNVDRSMTNGTSHQVMHYAWSQWNTCRRTHYEQKYWDGYWASSYSSYIQDEWLLKSSRSDKTLGFHWFGVNACTVGVCTGNFSILSFLLSWKLLLRNSNQMPC